jgi:hypothetical protein
MNNALVEAAFRDSYPADNAVFAVPQQHKKIFLTAVAKLMMEIFENLTRLSKTVQMFQTPSLKAGGHREGCLDGRRFASPIPLMDVISDSSAEPSVRRLLSKWAINSRPRSMALLPVTVFAGTNDQRQQFSLESVLCPSAEHLFTRPLICRHCLIPPAIALDPP